jgi:hypothetical protein
VANLTEIRDTLCLELRTYQKYMHILHLEDQKVWLSITQEQLGSELLRLKSSLEETYKISREMANDPKYEDRIAALNCMNDARLSIVQLLRDVGMVREIQPSQNTKGYIEKDEWRNNAETVLENER